MGGRWGDAARLLRGRESKVDHGPRLQPRRGAERRSVTGDALIGNEAGGDGAGQRELIGHEAVEPLGFGGDDAECNGGHQGSAPPAPFARSFAPPSSPTGTPTGIAPPVIAEA